MSAIDDVRNTFPAAAKDMKLNLQSVLKADKLTQPQVYGVALASAYYLGEEDLIAAIHDEADAAGVPEALHEDAKAAAAIMGMNTVYYRFRHMIGKESYEQLPARLRMTRMAKPATDKATFELCAMAVAALAGCEMCIRAHEESLMKEGVTAEGVLDCVRIAAVLAGSRVAMGM